MERKITIRHDVEKQRLQSFLETDRIWAGYAICDLEEEIFPLCNWHVAVENRRVISLCMHFNGLQPPAQITMGEPIGLAKILKTIDIPERIHAHIPPNHREVMNEFYNINKFHLMKRMFVIKETFKPIAGQAERMRNSDLRDIENLYAVQPGNFFRSYMLTSGVYYGLRKEGKLISVAGTHICSPTHSLACVGNVFTHPSYRGKGYATTCTSQTVSDLLTHFRDVILNVEDQNIAAIRVYRKLGFREHSTYFEAYAQCKKTN
ncbi:MAG: GNAT family N-acetyltransferase [Candidatus Bathyarchaeota archaeon]|nr:MAG: GNAT family N-acetyltransferase [Candidatus Bathyarchaeota archaeon]